MPPVVRFSIHGTPHPTFMQALATVDAFEVDGDTLSLRSGDDEVMTFTS